MERNRNFWSLVMMFFAMAILFAMRPIDAVSIIPAQDEVEFCINSPPDMQTIAIVNEVPAIITTWVAQSMPGVTVSCSATITDKFISVADVQSTNFMNNQLRYLFYYANVTGNINDRYKFRRPRDGL